MHPIDLKYITRHDYNDRWGNGWQVRVPDYDPDQPLITKWFPDKKHGGKKEALKEAKLFRSIALACSDVPLVDHVLTRKIYSKTGHHRIYKLKVKERKFRAGEWRIYFYNVFVARFPKGHNPETIRISIDRYGEKEALKLLIKEVKKLEMKRYGQAINRKVTKK